MPLAVGGGILRVEEVEQLIAGGADKVVVNTGALRRPRLIDEIASTFGAQSLVVSIDVTEGPGGQFVVMTGSRRDEVWGSLEPWLDECTARGAGEVMLCDVGRDGSGLGLNLKLGRRTVQQVSVPVILTGGAGTSEHFGEAYLESGVDAIAAGTLFSQRDQTPMQVRAHVHNLGIPVRIVT